ncbi:hypothetical protein THRCLA_22125 [Thraustotheca clavata]|uniref:Transmembrane protein n=1 Tax=Thraustotheca clavata TaxID=74557 RepID=A0A1V9ZBZ3_9STRA|nr:hypothetical protein THRCLA_22125 [Thraustotheca clavata]
MNLLNQYFIRSSTEHLLSLRATSRLLFACLAVNMLLQALFISFKLTSSVDASNLTSNAIKGLVASYTAWIFVSAIGGLSGLYSTKHYHTRTARVCMTSWVLLVLFQIVEGLIAIYYLSPGAHLSNDAQRILIVNTVALIVIELIFVGFIWVYIQLLEYCALYDYIKYTDIEIAELDSQANPLVKNDDELTKVPGYGTNI